MNASETPLNILLVDDREENLLTLSAVLNSPGYRLVQARSGMEALQAVEKESFVVILLDIQMPVMDGFETARLIRKNPNSKDTPIVFVTALDRDPKYIERGFQIGAVDYVFKPYEPLALRAKITLLTDLYQKNQLNKESKQRLLESETRFSMLVQGVKDYAIFMLDPEGYITSWNEGARRTERYEASEAIGKHFSIFYPEEVAKAGHPKYELERAVQEGRYEEEGWRLRKDRSRFWASVVITAIRDQSGKLLGFSKVVRDLTERKRTEEALRKSQDFLDSVVENIPNMVFVKDAKDLRYVRLNKSGEELVGTQRANIIGKSDFELYPESQAAQYVAKDRETLSKRKMIHIPEETFRNSEGELRVLRTTKIPLLGNNGKPEYLLGISEDITDWKKAESERLEFIRQQATLDQRKRETERTTFLSDAAVILASSLDYRVTLQKLSELLVKKFSDWCTVVLVRPDLTKDRVAYAHKDSEKLRLIDELARFYPAVIQESAGIGKVIKTGASIFLPEVKESDLRDSAKDARHLEIMKQLQCSSCIVTPIVARERVLGAISTVSSSENRVYNEEDLALMEELGRRIGIAVENSFLYEAAQEAIRARDEFISIASHELKTPITSLKLHLQMTRRATKPETGQAPPVEKLAKTLDAATIQINRLTALVEDLLDVTRIQSGKLTYNFESVDISALVKEVVERFAEQFRVSGCQVQVNAPSSIHARADRFRLEQVIINLLSNAAKYGANKPVEVAVEQLPDGGARISCRDHGMGIAQNMQGQVFERFVRAVDSNSISGLGLGLYITREIVHAHGGKISVESEPGEGSTFIVDLPGPVTQGITRKIDEPSHSPSGTGSAS